MKQYVLINKAPRILSINGVKLMMGVNIISEDSLKKMSASPYFNYHFEDKIADLPKNVAEKCEANLEFKKGFGPDDLKDKKDFDVVTSILKLSPKEFQDTIAKIMDYELLKTLQAKAEKGDQLTAIEEQLKNITPSEKEIQK